MTNFGKSDEMCCKTSPKVQLLFIKIIEFLDNFVNFY